MHTIHPAIHASFDVWNTLIAGNPDYADKRTVLLANTFSTTVERAKHTYTHVKQYADGIAAKFGVQFNTKDLYLLLCQHFDPLATTNTALHLQNNMEVLFRAHPPIWDNALVSMLKLMRKVGVTLSIGSNTNFISGRVMRQVVFSNWDVEFEFMLFSDEAYCAKPNIMFFNHIKSLVKMVKGDSFPCTQIHHFGDHHVCDNIGAQAANMTPILVTNPSDLLQHLTSKYHA